METGLHDASGEAAQLGERIHLWLEDSTKIKLAGEELALAKRCEEERLSMMSLLFDGWEDSPVVDLREKRLWFRSRRYSGKADFIAFRDKTALIADYKTGRTPVSHASGNHQLKWLAVLVAQHYKVEEVFIAVIQPLVGPYTLHRFDKPALDKARKEVLKVLRKVEDEMSQPSPGAVQCKYCKARQLCPALNQKAVELAKPLELTAALVTRQLDVVLALETMIELVKTRAKEMLLADPGCIPGYKLRPGSIRRSIPDMAKAAVALDKAGLLTRDELIGAASISLPALERAIAGKGMGKTDAKRSINTALLGLVEEKQSEPTLVHAEALDA